MTKRRHIPLAVKLAACLDAMGMTGEAIEWEHTIPLGLRAYDEMTGLYSPDEMDPRYLRPMAKGQHKLKTFGGHVPLSGDVSRIAKMKRLTAGESAFRERLLAKDAGDAPPAKPGRRWASRPFSSKRKISSP